MPASVARTRPVSPLQWLPTMRNVRALTAGYQCVGVVLGDAARRHRVLLLQLDASCDIVARSLVTFASSNGVPSGTVELDDAISLAHGVITEANVAALALGSGTACLIANVD